MDVQQLVRDILWLFYNILDSFHPLFLCLLALPSSAVLILEQVWDGLVLSPQHPLTILTAFNSAATLLKKTEKKWKEGDFFPLCNYCCSWQGATGRPRYVPLKA